MIKVITKNLVAFILVCAITFSTASVSACGEYAVFVYKVTKVENGQYWGNGVYDNSNIYFTQEFIAEGDSIKVNDVVIAYFDPDNIVDGLVEVEKTEFVGMDNNSY